MVLSPNLSCWFFLWVLSPNSSFWTFILELRKGQEYTKDFMEKYVKCLYPKSQDASQVGNAFTEVASFISKWSRSEGVSRVFLALKCEFSGPIKSCRDCGFTWHGLTRTLTHFALGFVTFIVYCVASPQLVVLCCHVFEPATIPT